MSSHSAAEDSEDSEEESSQSEFASEFASRKRPRLAVPETLTSLFAVPEAQTQALHQGRRRRVPHVEGNYPTLLFLPVDTSEGWSRCAELCAAALQALAGGKPQAEVHLVDADTAPGWHVSLSPLLILRRQFIDPLHNHLRSVARMAGSARPIFFDDCLYIFSSRERDRYFAGLCVSEASAGWLRKLSTGVLGAADALGLAGSFSPPTSDMRPHCSLAWTLADLGPGLEACGAECRASPWGLSWSLESSSLAAPLRSVPDPPDVQAAALFAKVGERLTSHPFPAA